MTPAEQRTLPLLRVMDEALRPSAVRALAMLDAAVDAYHGEPTSSRVSTLTTTQDVETFIALVVRHDDDHGGTIHATVQVQKNVHVAEMPLPRTSRDQAVWVRDMLRRTLEAPAVDAAAKPDPISDALRAHDMIDDADASHVFGTEIDTVAATPLGTGGIFVILDHGRTVKDVGPASALPGGVEIVLTETEEADDFEGVRIVLLMAAQCHTTAVPAMDAVERLRMTRTLMDRKAHAA